MSRPTIDRFATTFVLTKEHVMLLRGAYVSWNGDEFGAPSIDPKRPYGNNDALSDIAFILGMDKTSEDLTDEERERLLRLHAEMEMALQVVLATGSFEPGRYVRSRFMIDWCREG